MYKSQPIQSAKEIFSVTPKVINNPPDMKPMNSPSSREYAATDSLHLLDIEQVALEVFGQEWCPELVRAPEDLGHGHASYELHFCGEDGSCFEVTMETSMGFLGGRDREATVDFLKLLRNYLMQVSRSSSSE